MIAFIAALAILLGSVVVPAISPEFSPAVYAEEAQGSTEENVPDIWMQISPVTSRVTLTAGQTLEYTFIISNIGKEEFSYHVYAEPYTVTDEDYNVSFYNESSRTQVSRWISFKLEDGSWGETRSFTIKPGERQTVEYRIAVPDSVPVGGQYAAIFAESDQGDKAEATGIKTVSRVGLIVYGSTYGDTVESSEVTDIDIPTFITSGNFTVSGKLKNTGNTDFDTTYSFEVKSIFGKNLYSKENTYTIIPDSERRVSYEWEQTPGLGIFVATYKVSADIDCNDQDGNHIDGCENYKEETKVILIMPIFMLILLIILLTMLMVWVIILIRKRSEQRSRLLS